jgi:nicotinamide-nucleotide amidase
MFPPELLTDAERLLELLRAKGLRLVTAESCTGGLIAALLTEVPGSSDVLERGFVTYSNDAKIEAIGVPSALIKEFGAVSREVAVAMATGALAHSRADIVISVTGVAGPGGGTDEKPVGLVYLTVLVRGRDPVTKECRYGLSSRSAIRMATVDEALGLIRQVISS